jgi:hypothetical protein
MHIMKEMETLKRKVVRMDSMIHKIVTENK